MFQTDSDEDVIFVSEKSVPKSNEITFDQAKRVALQRDIDQQSQPARPLTSQRSVAVDRPEEGVKMKVKEETSGKNSVKKEKKVKKGQASLPENCTADDGSQAGVKKEEKNGKKVDIVVVDTEEESCIDGGEKEEKKKKKKRKIVTESLCSANGSDVKNENDEEINKKKKKEKRKRPEVENQVETAQSPVKEKEGKKEGKEKKVKKESVQIQSEEEAQQQQQEEEEKEQQAEMNRPKKSKKEKDSTLVVSTEEREEQMKEKKKKKKKKSTDVETTEATAVADGISVTKKKNKDKTKITGNQVKLETPEGEMGEAEEVKTKKKVKKLKDSLKEKTKKEEGNEVETPQIKGTNENKAEKDNVLNKRKDKSTKIVTVITEDGETEPKKKVKKEKSRKPSVEISVVEDTEPKKKKRKKGNSEEEEPRSLKCEEVEEQSGETPVPIAEDTTGKKRKRSSIKVEAQLEVNASSEPAAKKKKKKIKKEVDDDHESPQVDVVFLSEKSGNKDEVTINQERRQALQTEIDQASQPQKPAKPTGFGQWSTAQFDSSDRQQKFLRLMGGFKKGFQPAAGSTQRANMALGKELQQQLQQGLLGEFERAQSRRLDFSSRGAGLGFSAPSNKKFSIDINTCRSVRFDD